MRHSALKAVGHNIADSLATGMGFMIGVYATDVFAEAAAASPGYLEVDFLSAAVSGSPASASLKRAVELYCDDALPKLCRAHSIDLSEVTTLLARYLLHPVYGPMFTVTVADSRNRRSSATYAGLPGKRLFRRRARS